MKKEEFLKIIREENEENEPYEKEISSFTWKIGAIVSVALSLVIYFVEWFFWEKQNLGLFISVTSILAVKFVIEAIKVKNASTIVYAIIFSSSFVVDLVLYVIAFNNGWL